MIFPLIQDFADALAVLPKGHPRWCILALIEEAIRREQRHWGLFTLARKHRTNSL